MAMAAQKMLTGLLRTFQALALVAVTLLMIGFVLGGFLYWQRCETADGQVGRPTVGYGLKLIPYFAPAAEGCENDTATRVVLGNIGLLPDVTSRVPKPLDSSGGKREGGSSY